MQEKTSHFVCVCGQHQLSPKKDTIFEKSDTDLYKWFFALYLFSVSKNGVSAKELQRHLKVTYKTAWRIGNQIRKLFAEYNLTLSGEVEADETYIGGKGGNNKRGRGAEKKTAVFGMVQRKGSIKAEVVANVKAKTLLAKIENTVKKESVLMTDEFKSYNRVKKLGYGHMRVKHSSKQYVSGRAHTNTTEGFWSQLKRSINGTYHAVSPKHLQTYVDEFSWRYNRRELASAFEPLMARAGQRG
ncbi:MAG: IS1595 family transposase [Minisyncoccia bacterium]